MAYTVTAPLVVVRDEQGSYHHLYRGAPVPKFVSGGDVKRLADDGLIGEAEVAGEPSDSDASGAPAKSASKAEWVEFAVAQGMSEEDASAATKDDLVNAFGD